MKNVTVRYLLSFMCFLFILIHFNMLSVSMISTSVYKIKLLTHNLSIGTLFLGTMASTIDFSLNGSSLTIVRQCRPALVEILQSKFGCEARIEIMEFDRDLSVVHQKGPAVDIDQRFSTTLPAGVQVSVCKGDLTKFDADAVVNAANTSLQHYGGLALALSKAGGPIIQNDSYNYTRQHGDLKTGEAIMTNAGMLPCRNVIHAVGPQVSSYASQSEVLKAKVYLEKAISSILDLVKKSHLQSVAIPAISSGLFNFPLPLCADTIVSAVKNYYDVSQGHRPKQIFLVNNDEPTVREMERACKEILGSHTSMQPYSQTSGNKSKGAAGTATTTVELGKVRLTLKRGNIEQQQVLFIYLLLQHSHYRDCKMYYYNIFN